jgi:hypothetical protein
MGIIPTVGGKIIRHRKRDSNTGTVNGAWCGYFEVDTTRLTPEFIEVHPVR